MVLVGVGIVVSEGDEDEVDELLVGILYAFCNGVRACSKPLKVT